MHATHELWPGSAGDKASSLPGAAAMTAYLLEQKPSLGRQVRPQDSLALPSGAFLALVSFMRLCLDQKPGEAASPDQLRDHVPQLLGTAQARLDTNSGVL